MGKLNFIDNSNTRIQAHERIQKKAPFKEIETYKRK